MSDKVLASIGHVIDADMKRDAIHIAIAPVVATERLLPGQPIGLLTPDRVSGSEPHVGIVDPFLSSPVEEGERFWIFLFPNTVTSIRHDWQHPAFARAAIEEYKNGKG